jgi:hypothetical protein
MSARAVIHALRPALAAAEPHQRELRAAVVAGLHAGARQTRGGSAEHGAAVLRLAAAELLAGGTVAACGPFADAAALVPAALSDAGSDGDLPHAEVERRGALLLAVADCCAGTRFASVAVKAMSRLTDLAARSGCVAVLLVPVPCLTSTRHRHARLVSQAAATAARTAFATASAAAGLSPGLPTRDAATLLAAGRSLVEAARACRTAQEVLRETQQAS